MERWSVEHRAFAEETVYKTNDSVIVTQLIFRFSKTGQRFTLQGLKCESYTKSSDLA
jgi:hypothetical protein